MKVIDLGDLVSMNQRLSIWIMVQEQEEQLSRTFPQHKNLIIFLQNRCLVAKLADLSASATQPVHRTTFPPSNKVAVAELKEKGTGNPFSKTNFCKCANRMTHFKIAVRPKFREAVINSPINMVKQYNPCWTCLSGNHKVKACIS